jgi:hypothetical protein
MMMFLDLGYKYKTGNRV